MRVVFGEFVFDTADQRLYCDGREVRLAPKTLQLLSLFAENPNRLLSRDYILKTLWADTFVEEHALSVQVVELRKTLRDAAKSPRFIETIPRRGYRFMTETPPMPPASAVLAMPETRYAHSGDVNIAYQVVGDGAVDLVFIMGWVSHLEYFWREPHFAAFLRTLSTFSRLILFDKRGTGLSDRVPQNQLPGLEQRMDDLRAVMDAVSSGRAVIFGVSEGGPLATLFAATYPEKTLGLIMFGSYARRLWDYDYPWGPTKEVRDAYIEHIREHWGGPVGIEDRAPTLAQDPDFRDWWATYLRMGASPGAAATLTRMNAEIDVRPVLSSVRVPALIMHRRDDRCMLLAEGRYLASQIAGAAFIDLPGADHLPFVGDQTAVLTPIREFVENLSAGVETDLSLSTVVCLEAHTKLSPELSVAVQRQIERFRGKSIDPESFSPLAAFDGPARAVRCAHAIVSLASDAGVGLRVAIHTGECDVPAFARAGRAVLNIAAAMLEGALPGQVLVSRVVRDLVADSSVEFSEAGKLAAALGEALPLFAVRSC